MRMTAQSNGQRRGRSSNSTQAAFTLTAGRKAVTVSGGVISINDGTNTHPVVLVGRFRGATLGFGGVGSNNQTANFRLWLVRLGFAATEPSPSPDPLLAIDADVTAYIADTSTITLGTATGITGSGGIYTASELIADTVSATLATTATTPPGSGTVAETAYALGTAQAYSPADNTAAKLIIPHLCGAHGFIVEFDMTGATSMNFDYELTL